MSDQKKPTVSICNCSHKLPNFMIHFALSKSISPDSYFSLMKSLIIFIGDIPVTMIIILTQNPPSWSSQLFWTLDTAHVLVINIDPAVTESPGSPGRCAVYRCFPHGVWVRTETGECGETGSRWDSHGYTPAPPADWLYHHHHHLHLSKARSLSQPTTGIILTIVHHLHSPHCTALLELSQRQPAHSTVLCVLSACL